MKSRSAVLLVVSIGVFLALAIKSKIAPSGQQRTTEFATPTSPLVKKELSGQLAQEFPPFPVYPEATPESSLVQTEAGVTTLRARWTVGTSVEKAVKWYRNALQAAGWTVSKSDNPTSEFQQEIDMDNGTWEGKMNIDGPEQAFWVTHYNPETRQVEAEPSEKPGKDILIDVELIHK